MEVLYYNCCWIQLIIILSVVDASLSQKRCPSCSVRPTNIRPGVITDHEKNQLLRGKPASQLVLNKFKGFQLRLAEIYMLHIERILFTVIFQDIVKGSESYSRSFVSSGPDDIILGCEISRQGLPICLLLAQNVMDDFKCCFVGTDIVHGENGAYFLNPFLEGIRNTATNSFLNVLLYLFDLQCPCLVRGKILILLNCIMFHLMVILMKKGVELIARDVIFYTKIFEYLLDLEGSCNQNPLTFLAMLNDLRFQRSVVHKHVLSCKIVFQIEYGVDLIGFFALQIAASIGQAGKWDFMRRYFMKCIQSGFNGSTASDKNSINISHQDRVVFFIVELFKMSDQFVYFLILFHDSNYFIHLNPIIKTLILLEKGLGLTKIQT